MIKEITTEVEISGENSPLLPRIFNVIKYKSGSDNAWQQVDKTGERTALLSSVDGNFTLIATEKTDFEEIKEFAHFFGCSSIISNIPFTTSAKSYALYKVIDYESTKKDFCYLILDRASTVSQYRKFHSLLFADTQVDFDAWYYDFSKKIVNNDAKAVALTQFDVFLSIATAPMIYKNTALISGVYTLKDFRNKGFSKATIYKLIDELKKDNVTDVFLWCEKEVEEFYEKIGFQKVGNVYRNGVIK